MNDRELLELAAKAAGIDLSPQVFESGNARFHRDGFYKYHKEGFVTLRFRPLSDDGDAMRLAVNLRIHLTNSAVDAWASTEKFIAIEPLKKDPCAATRRAIVRAAAEIGKGMP